MFKYILSLFLIVFICAGYAAADFYKWEDADGNLHIIDYPPPSPSAKKVKIHETDAGSRIAPSPSPRQAEALPRRTDSADRPQQQPAHEVILYTTSWCPYCKKAKAFFDARGIPYTEYDIEKDRDAAERKKELTGSGGVPFAIVNGVSISGFAPGSYEAALRKNY